jgi:xanthine/uracil permease
MTRIIKLASLVLVTIGIIVLCFDPRTGAELPLLIGLFMGFVSRDKMEDERAVHLKTSSAYISLVVGYGFKLLTSNLYDHKLISFQLSEINHFLILVFGFATILYYSRVYLSAR